MKTKISVTKTNAETFINDADRCLSSAGIDQHFDSQRQTLLKVNISWQYYYPACSTTPWQLEGAINSLRGHGFNDLLSVHNGTVVVDPVEGARNNKHINVTKVTCRRKCKFNIINHNLSHKFRNS